MTKKNTAENMTTTMTESDFRSLLKTATESYTFEDLLREYVTYKGVTITPDPKPATAKKTSAKKTTAKPKQPTKTELKRAAKMTALKFFEAYKDDPRVAFADEGKTTIKIRFKPEFADAFYDVLHTIGFAWGNVRYWAYKEQDRNAANIERGKDKIGKTKQQRKDEAALRRALRAAEQQDNAA